ncbi:MAG: MBL fold metallo-hydrolase [Victivallales bacterium]|nr:MBL fold metallo-hydrolase [Victivallales bacterium]
MRIQILGTAAAEACPAIFCDCENCQEIRRRGDVRDVRRRASYLIDEDTLVDFGPDAFFQATAFQIDLTKIRRILFTHAHLDHQNATDLMWRHRGYSRCSKPIRLLGSHYTLGILLSRLSAEGESISFAEVLAEPVELACYQEATDGDLGILPLEADHAPGKAPMLYLISRGGKTLLVGNDTGYFLPKVWEHLAGKHIDAALLDCTSSLHYANQERGHMGANTVVKVAERLREMGCADDSSRLVATHFSHNGGSIHTDLEAFFAPHRIEVAYDGLALEV